MTTAPAENNAMSTPVAGAESGEDDAGLVLGQAPALDDVAQKTAGVLGVGDGGGRAGDRRTHGVVLRGCGGHAISPDGFGRL